MHIRRIIGALVAACALAFAPVAMADPAPDICVLELTSAHFIDISADIAADKFQAPAFAVCEKTWITASALVLSPDGDDEDAAHPRLVKLPASFDFASARLHYDPGRLLA